jgi:hypothetical protein
MDAIQQFILSDLLSKAAKKEITIAEYQELLTATLSATMKAQRLAKEELAQTPEQVIKAPDAPKKATASTTTKPLSDKTAAVKKVARKTQVAIPVKKKANGFQGEIDESNVEDYIDYFEDDLDEAFNLKKQPVVVPPPRRGRPQKAKQ